MPESITATPMPAVRRTAGRIDAQRACAATNQRSWNRRTASASTGASIETDSTSSRSAIASRLSARSSAVSAEIESWSYLMSDCVRRSASLHRRARASRAAARSRACDDRLHRRCARGRCRICASTGASRRQTWPDAIATAIATEHPDDDTTSIPKPTCPLVKATREPTAQRMAHAQRDARRRTQRRAGARRRARQIGDRLIWRSQRFLRLTGTLLQRGPFGQLSAPKCRRAESNVSRRTVASHRPAHETPGRGGRRRAWRLR